MSNINLSIMIPNHNNYETDKKNKYKYEGNDNNEDCFEWKSVFYEVLDENQILDRVFENVIELEVEIQNALWNRFFGNKIENYFINEKQNILFGLEVFESRMSNQKGSLAQIYLFKRNQKLISNVDDLLKNYFEEKKTWWT